jgi:hypothetical protein
VADPSLSVKAGPIRLAGERLLALADQEHLEQWVRRRVENVNFHDDRAIQHEVELHVDLRYVDPRIHTCAPKTDVLLLPLMTLKREGHTAIDIFDSDGSRIGRVNRAEERKLVADGIACRMVGHESSTLPDVRLAVFEYINEPLSPTLRRASKLRVWLSDALRAAAQHLDGSTARHNTGVPASRDQLIARLANLGVADHMIIEKLRDVDFYHANHLLVGEVPYRCGSGSQVVTMRYRSSVPPKPRTIKTIARRLCGGTLSVSAAIPLNAVAAAASFHVNVFAPVGFKVVDGLVARCPSGHADPESAMRKGILRNRPKDLQRNGCQLVLDDDRLPYACHVYVPNGSASEDLPDATMYVSLYTNRTGFFLESWLVSVSVAALLLVYNLKAHQNGLPFQHEGVLDAPFDANFASAVLLLFPAISVAVITQRDEHRMAARTLALARSFLFLLALGGVVSALPFAVNFGPHLGLNLLLFGTVTSCFVAVRFTTGGLLHLWRVSNTRAQIMHTRRTVNRPPKAVQ